MARPLAERLRRQIEEGELRPGARLGSIRQLAEEAGCSPYQVLAAFRELEGLGLVDARHGSGFYITVRSRGIAPVLTAPGLDRLLDTALLIRGFVEPSPLLKCGSGVLPKEWLEGLALPRHVRAVAGQPATDLYDYGSALGYPALREALQDRLRRRHIPCPAEGLTLTTGLSHGLELVVRALCRPGDRVFVESPAYYNLFGLLKISGLELREIPRGPEGPDLAALESLLREGQVPRLFFLQPLLHNPTGASLEPGAAHRLLALAERHGFLLVENDAYGDLAGDQDLRLAALDGLRRVVYLSGFTKTLSAALRVGYAAAGPEVAEALGRAKLLTGIASPEFPERVVFRVLTEGGYDRFLGALRTRLLAARAAWVAEAGRAGWEVAPADPRGMFAWARHPAFPDSMPLAKAAAAAGLWLAPGAAFDPEHRPSPWLRFNVAYRSPALSAWLKRPR